MMEIAYSTEMKQVLQLPSWSIVLDIYRQCQLGERNNTSGIGGTAG